MWFDSRRSVRFTWRASLFTLLRFLTVRSLILKATLDYQKTQNAEIPIQKPSADTKLVRNCISDTVTRKV